MLFSALIRHCERFCTDKARTVTVRAKHIAILLEMENNKASCSMIGQILHDVMYYLKGNGVDVRIYVSNRRRYVLSCHELDRIRRLLEKYQRLG